MEYMLNRTNRIGSNCKKSCSILQYSGKVIDKSAFEEGGDYGYYGTYGFNYQMINFELMSTVHEEYLIYNTMGMIGSVGGTLGLFIGFSMTGVISYGINYLKNLTFFE